MKLLLDTHVFIAWARGKLVDTYPKFNAALESEENSLFLSVSSIWEIAIKVGIGKLDAGIDPALIKGFCQDAGIGVVAIFAEHATAVLDLVPPTRDPFDRMLLSQCAVEGMKLVTADKLLTGHPLVLSA